MKPNAIAERYPATAKSSPLRFSPCHVCGSSNPGRETAPRCSICGADLSRDRFTRHLVAGFDWTGGPASSNGVLAG